MGQRVNFISILSLFLLCSALFFSSVASVVVSSCATTFDSNAVYTFTSFVITQSCFNPNGVVNTTFIGTDAVFTCSSPPCTLFNVINALGLTFINFTLQQQTNFLFNLGGGVTITNSTFNYGRVAIDGFTGATINIQQSTFYQSEVEIVSSSSPVSFTNNTINAASPLNTSVKIDTTGSLVFSQNKITGLVLINGAGNVTNNQFQCVEINATYSFSFLDNQVYASPLIPQSAVYIHSNDESYNITINGNTIVGTEYLDFNPSNNILSLLSLFSGQVIMKRNVLRNVVSRNSNYLNHNAQVFALFIIYPTTLTIVDLQILNITAIYSQTSGWGLSASGIYLQGNQVGIALINNTIVSTITAYSTFNDTCGDSCVSYNGENVAGIMLDAPDNVSTSANLFNVTIENVIGGNAYEGQPLAVGGNATALWNNGKSPGINATCSMCTISNIRAGNGGSYVNGGSQCFGGVGEVSTPNEYGSVVFTGLSISQLVNGTTCKPCVIVNYTHDGLTCGCGDGYSFDNSTISCNAICSAGCGNGFCTAPGKCSCVGGWEGTTCNIFVCPQGCNNGGMCVGPYACSCTPGWSGTTCSTPTGTNPCGTNNGGCDFHTVCTQVNTSVVCGACPEGFEGSGAQGCIALCGDGTCDGTIGETCVTCPFDCTTFPCNECGDGSCDPTIGEDCSSCAADCGTCSSLPCPGTPPCSNHGTCNGHKGQCECVGQFSGPACSVENTPINVNVNNSGGSVVINPTTNSQNFFVISIRTIQEVDANGKIVFPINLENRNYSASNITTSESVDYTFKTVLENRANLTIVVRYFTSQSSVVFANLTTQYSPNTIKLSIRVDDWPFMSLSNNLAFVLDAMEKSSGGSTSCVNSQKDENGNLQWFALTINGVTVYGQFIDEAMVDGKVRIMNFTFDQSSNFVTATVPHFWESVEIDPSYSVLLGLDSSETNCEQEEKSKRNVHKVIYIAVFCSIGGAAIIGVIVYLVLKPTNASRMRGLRKRVKAAENENL